MITVEMLAKTWEDLSCITIELSSNPREEGPGYVSSKIQEVRKAAGRLNDLASPILRYLGEAKVRVGQLKLERESRKRNALAQISAAQVASVAERQSRAEVMADQGFMEEQLVGMFIQKEGRKPTGNDELKAFLQTLSKDQIPRTLDQEYMYWFGIKENLVLLTKAIDNKRHELKGHDAAIRLQHQAIDTELRAFGITGNPLNMPPIVDRPSIQSRGRPSIQLTDDDEDEFGQALIDSEDFDSLTQQS